VGEESPSPKLKELCKHLGYIHFKSDSEHFHRTRVLNQLARASSSQIIVNYDADVVLKPDNIFKTVELLRQGTCQMSYPYSGMFRNIMGDNITKFEKSLDLTLFHNGNTHELSPKSFGGSIFWNKKDFMEVGLENENFKSWGMEDNERFARATKLGKKIFRVPGVLYHLNHSRGINSSPAHEFFQKNADEFKKIRELSKEDLEKYISTWEWAK
jgi:predicted glycosyltransferase involved in capsule biosynthesis